MRCVLDCALIVNLGSNSHPKSAYFLSLRIINRFFFTSHIYVVYANLTQNDTKWRVWLCPHQWWSYYSACHWRSSTWSLVVKGSPARWIRWIGWIPCEQRVNIADARLTKNGCDPENRWVQRVQDDVWTTLGRWRAYLSFDKFCWWVYSSTFSGVMFFRAIWCALMWSCTWIVYWIWGMPKWPMWKASCCSSWPSNPCEIGWNYWLNYMKLDVKQNE
jgi:hypothetical protein